MRSEQSGVRRKPDSSDAERRLTFGFVCFFWGRLPGGHARSASRIALQIERQDLARVRLIAVGREVSDLWLNQQENWRTVVFDRIRSVPAAMKALRMSLQDVDVVFVFDVVAMFLVRIASLGAPRPVVAVVPGGKAPRHYPRARYIIVMSEELMDFFRTEPAFSGAQVTLLEHRIDLGALSAQETRLRPEWWPVTRYSVGRIARIGSYYERGLRVTASAVSELRSLGLDVGLVLMGPAEDRLLVDELTEHAERLNVDADRPIARVMTDESVIRDAGHFIRHASVAVGAGDSALEAMFLGVPTLIVGPQGGVAVVSESTIPHLARNNFTGRELSPQSVADDVRQFCSIVESLLRSESMRDACVEAARRTVETRFSLEGAGELVCRVASLAQDAPLRGVPFDGRLLRAAIEWCAVCFLRRSDADSH